LTETVRLTPLGRALLGLAVILVVAGAATGAPVLIAQAALLIAVLATAHRAHHRRMHQVAAFGVELTLPDGPSVVRGQPLSVELGLRRRTPGPVLPVQFRLRVGGAVLNNDAWTLPVPPHAETRLHRSIVFARTGHWWLHGVELNITGPLRLVEAWGYATTEQMVTVRPAAVAPHVLRMLRQTVGSVGEQAGPNRTRQIGDGAEVRELREYVPGDPLRAIAWRATARRGRLLVRATEEERRRRIQLLLNIGPTMRRGVPGSATLDTAIDLCAAIFSALPADRLGLTTYDHRVYGHIGPASGRVARQRAQRHLFDLGRVVDADLTEISAGALAARVGRFLETQDQVRLLRIDPDHPRLARTLVDPLGELYDAGHLFAAVTDFLAQARTQGHAALFAKQRPAKDTFEARLRLFCALRGITLPYRLTGPADAAEAGLRAALTQNLGARSADELWVISDLEGLTEDGPAIRAMAGLIARKKRVVLIALGPVSDVLRSALYRAHVRIVPAG
jgi:uncharacterized protein (DUF58 family)